MAKFQLGFELVTDRMMPRHSQRKSLYFIYAEMVDMVKIGIADIVEARLMSIQQCCPLDLVCLHVVHNADSVLEKHIHRLFKEYHVRGEWFKLGGDLREYLATQLEDLRTLKNNHSSLESIDENIHPLKKVKPSVLGEYIDKTHLTTKEASMILGLSPDIVSHYVKIGKLYCGHWAGILTDSLIQYEQSITGVLGLPLSEASCMLPLDLDTVNWLVSEGHLNTIEFNNGLGLSGQEIKCYRHQQEGRCRKKAEKRKNCPDKTCPIFNWRIPNGRV